MFFKKQSSMVSAGDGVTVHPKAVCAVVSWAAPFSEPEREAAMKAGMGVAISANRSESVHVQPELKLPTKGEKGLDWTSWDVVHPYSFIKRIEKDDSQANGHLEYQGVTHVQACSFEPVSSVIAALAPATEPFSVSLPCIVNMQKYWREVR